MTIGSLEDAAGGISAQGPEFDVTPEILYAAGKATEVTTYCVFNRTDLGSSTYSLQDGKYREFHIDPEHGGGGPVIVDDERLAQLLEMDRRNPHSIPVLAVLGRAKSEVDALLVERKITARHLGEF